MANYVLLVAAFFIPFLSLMACFWLDGKGKKDVGYVVLGVLIGFAYFLLMLYSILIGLVGDYEAICSYF